MPEDTASDVPSPSLPPGLPCWIALVVTRDDKPATEEPTRRSQRVSCGIFLAFLGLVLLALYLGYAAMRGGSHLPMWIVTAHLPYLWSAYGTRRFFKRRMETLDQKPQVQIGSLRVYGYEPAHVRAGGLYRDEERRWQWDHFAGSEFVGESGGWYVVRLHERSKEAVPTTPSRTPWVVRYLNVVRFFGWHKSSFFLAALVPPIATALLMAAAWVRNPWSLEFGCAVCALALHVIAFSVFFGASRGGAAAPKSDKDDCLHLLFDSRQVPAQEAIGRLEAYLAAGTEDGS